MTIYIFQKNDYPFKYTGVVYIHRQLFSLSYESNNETIVMTSTSLF